MKLLISTRVETKNKINLKEFIFVGFTNCIRRWYTAKYTAEKFARRIILEDIRNY
jgi:hypothetical protein